MSAPRLDVRPAADGTHGDVAIEFAKLADLVLDPWQCDTVNHWLSYRSDSKWSAFECALVVPRQNGKSQLVVAFLMTHLLLLSTPLALYSAHQVKTSLEIFRNLKTLIRTLEDRGVIPRNQVKALETNGAEGFENLATGARLKFVARSKQSVRGFSPDVIVIDEAFDYNDAEHAALLPSLSARPNPQMVYLSSPPLDGETADILFSLRKRATAGSPWALSYREWGQGGNLDNLAKLDLADPVVWAASNPAYGIRLAAETVEREHNSMSRVDFARERLGVWPRQSLGGGAIDLGHWATLADPESKRSGAVAVGVDVAPDRSYSAVSLYGVREDGVGHLQLVDYRPGTEWVVERMLELKGALDVLGFALGRGTYASLLPELKAARLRLPKTTEKTRRGDVVPCAGPESTSAVGQMLDAVKQATFRHRPMRELDASVAGARIRETGDVVAWSRKDAAADATPLSSATYARWLYVSREALVRRANYSLLESVY